MISFSFRIGIDTLPGTVVYNVIKGRCFDETTANLIGGFIEGGLYNELVGYAASENKKW